MKTYRQGIRWVVRWDGPQRCYLIVSWPVRWWEKLLRYPGVATVALDRINARRMATALRGQDAGEDARTV